MCSSVKLSIKCLFPASFLVQSSICTKNSWSKCVFFMCPTSWTFKHGGPKYFQTRGCLVSGLPSAMCYIRERATSVDVLRSLKFVSLFAVCCFGQQASEVFLWAWMLRADFQYSRHFTLVQGKQVKLTRTHYTVTVNHHAKKGWAHLSGTEQSVIYLYLPLGQGQVSAMEKVFFECSVRNNS